MNKEFITYEQARDLKELGFNDPCLAFYNGEFLDSTEYDFDSGLNKDYGECPSAPLKQQIFNWFEKKHSIYLQRIVSTNVNEILDISYDIRSWRFPTINVIFENPYDCFDKDKAEQICIDEMIKIIKKL